VDRAEGAIRHYEPHAASAYARNERVKMVRRAGIQPLMAAGPAVTQNTNGTSILVRLIYAGYRPGNCSIISFSSRRAL
jgi:hypothetical protein